MNSVRHALHCSPHPKISQNGQNAHKMADAVFVNQIISRDCLKMSQIKY